MASIAEGDDPEQEDKVRACLKATLGLDLPAIAEEQILEHCIDVEGAAPIPQ